jgi:enamine deaminase RidA (YjgF/YER057c/UK114 family)
MNRIYAGYFSEDKYPARTTTIVDLNNPDFLLEIEFEAVLE